MRASEAVLDRLAKVLRLDPAEHRHLFVLARGHLPADPMDAPAVVDARLQSVLDALPYPAYAATNGWTIVAWNRAARVVFAEYEKLSGRERNIVWMAFTDPDHRRMALNWEEQARSAFALFRATTAQNVDEDWHKRFVAELAERSPEFRAWWPRHDVRGSHAGPKVYNHPIAGRMVFEPMTLRYEADAMLWVMIKVPVHERTPPPSWPGCSPISGRRGRFSRAVEGQSLWGGDRNSSGGAAESSVISSGAVVNCSGRSPSIGAIVPWPTVDTEWTKHSR